LDAAEAACRAYPHRVASVRRFTPTSEWENPHQLRGIRGEHVALAYLTACGWDIEAHRFRLGHHDIDLVARRGDLVAFVEVKTRHSAVCGSAVEAVSRLKQRLISRVALLWRLRHGRPSDEYRFDLVAVHDLGSGHYEVDHVPDAWRLEWSGC
jgi:putative endonuclease